MDLAAEINFGGAKMQRQNEQTKKIHNKLKDTWLVKNPSEVTFGFGFEVLSIQEMFFFFLLNVRFPLQITGCWLVCCWDVAQSTNTPFNDWMRYALTFDPFCFPSHSQCLPAVLWGLSWGLQGASAVRNHWSGICIDSAEISMWWWRQRRRRQRWL